MRNIFLAGCVACSALVPPAQSSDQAPAPVQAQTESATAPPEVYKPGGDVSAPKLIHHVSPQYTKEARKKKIKGVTVLSIVVDAEGNPRQVTITRAMADSVKPELRSAAVGLDENAVETVKQFRFRPSMLNGKPVAVSIHVEIHYWR